MSIFLLICTLFIAFYRLYLACGPTLLPVVRAKQRGVGGFGDEGGVGAQEAIGVNLRPYLGSEGAHTLAQGTDKAGNAGTGERRDGERRDFSPCFITSYISCFSQYLSIFPVGAERLFYPSILPIQTF